MAVAAPVPTLAFFDIGANLLSGQYDGFYNGRTTRSHASDLASVLARADAARVREVIITAGSLSEARDALALARSLNASGLYAVRLYSTVGVHPTRTNELGVVEEGGDGGGGGSGVGDDSDVSGPVAGTGCCGDDAASTAAAAPAAPALALDKASYVAALDAVIADGLRDGTVVAVGECGLDYDRTAFASAATQRAHLELHWELAARHGLPLFLHDRASRGDLAAAALRLRTAHAGLRGGVVHSFTGSMEEMHACLAAGLDIGVNGCSLKTQEGVAVAAAVPLARLHLETDAPWCEVKRR